MNPSSCAPQASTEGDLARRLAGKYMTFRLAEEVYGLEIVKVREIIALMPITAVPRAPDFLRGVINLRGKVIPVVDLRVKFGMPAADATDQTVIIVVQCEVGGQPLTMGVLVDQVLEVLSMDASQIEPPPSFGGAATDHAFIRGVGKAPGAVVFLLDAGKVLAADEAAELIRSAA